MPDERPDISVIMPVFNGAAFLDRAVRSVLAQGFFRWELLAVDDSSQDGSFDRLLNWSKADSRIRFWRLPTNRGPAAARNHALRQARGAIVAYLDCDDEYYPDFLGQVHRHQPGWDVLMFAYDIVYPSSPSSAEPNVTSWDPAPFRGRIMQEHIAVPLGVTHQRRLLDKAGLFDEGLSCEEDSDLWRRFARAGAFFWFLPLKSGRYHVRPDSQSRTRKSTTTA
jgi:glycosyltransferase involved in cell wall biosynthesis